MASAFLLVTYIFGLLAFDCEWLVSKLIITKPKRTPRAIRIVNFEI